MINKYIKKHPVSLLQSYNLTCGVMIWFADISIIAVGSKHLNGFFSVLLDHSVNQI